MGAATGLGLLPSAVAFTGALGGLCYFAGAPLLDKVNGGLVALILASFFGLLTSAAAGVDPAALLRADWGAVPSTLPVIALSFVYHNGGPRGTMTVGPGAAAAGVVGQRERTRLGKSGLGCGATNCSRAQPGSQWAGKHGCLVGCCHQLGPRSIALQLSRSLPRRCVGTPAKSGLPSSAALR
jgi:hypothetical protein